MKKFIIIFSLVLGTTGLHAAFNPWNGDVKTGDELNQVKSSGKRTSSVYNGAQGGAFILIRFFQVVISPQDGANCRHIPTCSAYGKQAVIKHGAFLGSIMAGERLLRCNPFYPPERDPVPDKVFSK